MLTSSVDYCMRNRANTKRELATLTVNTVKCVAIGYLMIITAATAIRHY